MSKYLYDDACADILTQSINEQNISIAHDFVKNGRINIWKPVLKTNNYDENKLYCYLNNHGTKDIALRDAKCDSSLFSNNVDFVTNIFTDGNRDATRTKAFDKCIFEIDKSKIGTNINTFWEELGGLQCKGIRRRVFNDNIRLRKLIEDLEKEINKQYIDIRDKISKLNTLNKTVQQLTVQRDKIKESLNIRIKEIEKVKLVHEKLLLKTEGYKLHAEGIIKQLEAEINRLKGEYESMMISINNYNKYISTNNVVRERETLRLGVLINTIKSQREIYEQKTKEYEEIRKQLNLIISELSTILKDIAVIERDLHICSDMKDKYTEDIDSFKNQMVECIQNRDLVKNKLKTCETYLSEIVEKIKQLNIDIPKTDDELKESERLRVKQKQTLTTIERDHKGWIPYPHFSCDKEKEEYNVSEYARLNDSDMCKSRVETANKTYVDLLNKEYQRKIDMMRDCKMNMFNVTPLKSVYAGIDIKYDGEVPFETMPNFKNNWIFYKTSTKAKSDGDQNDKDNWRDHMSLLSTQILSSADYRRLLKVHQPKSLGYDPVLPGSDAGIDDADSFDEGGDFFVLIGISPVFTVSYDQNIIFNADVDDGLVVFVIEDGVASKVVSIPRKKKDDGGQARGSYHLKRGKTYTISFNFYQHDASHYLRWYGSGINPSSICYPRK